MVRCLTAMLLLFTTGMPQAPANDDTSEASKTQQFRGKHRLDLSLSRIDTDEGDVTILLPGYTLAVGSGLRFNVTGSLQRGTQGTGVGDTLFVFQYDPTRQITASPWIPDTLGLNTTIRAPTGNADKGFGVDNWLVNMGAGWAIDAYRNLWLVPAGYYETTFSEEEGAADDEEIGISLNFIWLFDNGIWIGYEPTIARNLKLDELADDHTFVLGKIFRNGIGLGLEYGHRDRLDLTATRDDYTTLLNFYYIFGQTP